MSSSLTHSSLPPLQSSDSFRKDVTPLRSPDTSLTLTGSLRQGCNLVLAPLAGTTTVSSPSTSTILACFYSHLPVPPTAGNPWLYCAGLKPTPAEFCPIASQRNASSSGAQCPHIWVRHWPCQKLIWTEYSQSSMSLGCLELWSRFVSISHLL